MQTAVPATPARAIPNAKVTALTPTGLIPRMEAACMFSDTARTALPIMVFFRNRKTRPVDIRATTATISLVTEILRLLKLIVEDEYHVFTVRTSGDQNRDMRFSKRTMSPKAKSREGFLPAFATHLKSPIYMAQPRAKKIGKIKRNPNNGSMEEKVTIQYTQYAARMITAPWAMNTISIQPKMRLSPIAATPYMHPRRIPLMNI